jgi:hypothetical protein
MKKIIFLFVAVVATSFTFVSCSSDDDGGTNNSDLLGKWEYFQEGEVINGVEVLENYAHTVGCSKDYTEFLANGTAKDYSYFNNSPGACEETVFTSNWTRSGNNIALSIGGISSTAEIITLNATTLKVRYTDEDGTFVDVFTKAAN